MRTFSLTSPQFSGEIELQYNDDLQLMGMQIHAELSLEQHRWFTQNLPPTLEELKHLLKEKKSPARLMEVKFEPTFEDFWNLYDDKQLSSKKRASMRWHKMPRGQRLKAFHYVQTYFSGIPAGIRKKYAETYLNAELWNN